MKDMAVFCPAACGIDLPRLRCRGDQHRPRRGAGFAQPLPLRPGARAAAGHLNAELSVVVGRVHWRGFDSDLGPICVELFRDEHRERGIDSLAHLGVVDDNRDRVIRANSDKRVGREGRG